MNTQAGVDAASEPHRPAKNISVGAAGRADRVQAALEVIIPAITVDIVHLFTREEPLITVIRIPVWMMFKDRPNFSGELHFSTESIVALANFVGVTDVECWQTLAKSTVHGEPEPSGGVSPLLNGVYGRARRRT